MCIHPQGVSQRVDLVVFDVVFVLAHLYMSVCEGCFYVDTYVRIVNVIYIYTLYYVFHC